MNNPPLKRLDNQLLLGEPAAAAARFASLFAWDSKWHKVRESASGARR